MSATLKSLQSAADMCFLTYNSLSIGPIYKCFMLLHVDELEEISLWPCRCPAYTDLPPECTLGPDPADPLCCHRPLCQFVPQPNKTEGYLIPPLRPWVLTGGSVTPTPLPYTTPTPGPDGSTLEPPRTTPEPKSRTISLISFFFATIWNRMRPRAFV